MSRIRTIKPEFFTSEDIVSLPAMARILYIALWCEADKEGRLAWKPVTFKIRYLPADECNIDELCGALVARGLVIKYGEGYAYIPRFKDHQHINPREKDSVLPSPESTREPRVSDATVTHREEGKGKEGVEDASHDASSLSALPPTRVGELCILLRRSGVNTSPDAVSKTEWSTNPGVTDDIIRSALETAKKRSPRQITPAYLSPIISDLLAQAKAVESMKLVAGKDYI